MAWISELKYSQAIERGHNSYKLQLSRWGNYSSATDNLTRSFPVTNPGPVPLAPESFPPETISHVSSLAISPDSEVDQVWVYAPGSELGKPYDPIINSSNFRRILLTKDQPIPYAIEGPVVFVAHQSTEWFEKFYTSDGTLVSSWANAWKNPPSNGHSVSQGPLLCVDIGLGNFGVSSAKRAQRLYDAITTQVDTTTGEYTYAIPVYGVKHATISLSAYAITGAEVMHTIIYGASSVIYGNVYHRLAQLAPAIGTYSFSAATGGLGAPSANFYTINLDVSGLAWLFFFQYMAAPATSCFGTIAAKLMDD